MDVTFEKLSQFFEQVKSFTFWQRLFNWSQFRRLSYEAYEEFRSLLSINAKISQELEQRKNEISILKNDNEHFKTTNTSLESEIRTIKDKLGENTGIISEAHRFNCNQR